MEAKLKRLGMAIVTYLEGIDDDADDDETECLIEKMNICTPKTSRIKLPSMVGMFLQEDTCPYGGEEEGAGQIFILRNGTAQIKCSGCTKTSIANLDPKNHKGTREFMEHFWGMEACMHAMNKRFVQVARGKRIMEHDSKNVVCVYSQAEWLAFYKGHTDLDKKELGPAWLVSPDRVQCRDVVFDPRRPFGIDVDGGSLGDFNEYAGFAITPTASGEIEFDHGMDKVLDCLASLIQRPWGKLGVHLAWPKNARGAGMDLTESLERIFGIYANRVIWDGRSKLQCPEKTLLLIVSVVGSVVCNVPAFSNSHHVACVIFLYEPSEENALAVLPAATVSSSSRFVTLTSRPRFLGSDDGGLLRFLLEKREENESAEPKHKRARQLTLSNWLKKR